MKRMICALLILLIFIGCGKKTVVPITLESQGIVAVTHSPTSTPTRTPLQATPAATAAEMHSPALPTFALKAEKEALFAEELLSQDGEPVCTKVMDLVTYGDESKQAYRQRLVDIVIQVIDLDDAMNLLAENGRTMTANRKASTAAALTELISDEMLVSIDLTYSKLPGEGEELPLVEYYQSIDRLLQDLDAMEERTVPFFTLDKKSASDYRTVLSRYMGEPVDPRDMLNALEELAQTEAYAIYTATQADPEAVRKKEPISLGSFSKNLSLLRNITQELCPLPDGSLLSIPSGSDADKDKDLLQLAFRYYPGITFLKTYSAHASPEQQARWENAPVGYLAGLAVHASYAVIPYLDDFEMEYLQYHWYEEMLYSTFTGISSLLIHYYGYSEEDLSAYLQSWGADDLTEYLYEKAMFDPFESLAASYGYYQYLDICQAALDAGCENERRFYRDYLEAGPAPFQELKEYMVGLYQNQG